MTTTLKRVYLIRHGQTDWNVAGRWQGFEEVPLNAEGWMQARALAAYLQRPLTAIYSSDLMRARQTAEALGEALGITPRFDARLRELNLGVFQGLTFEEISARYPDEAHHMRSDYMGYLVPKGESRFQLQARAYEAWLDILASTAGEEAALVSHGGTIKVLLLKLFPTHPELQHSHIGNTSVTTLELNGSDWQLRELNALHHLVMNAADRDMH